MARETRTGGRDATTAIVPGDFALSIGKPSMPIPDGFEWRLLTDMAQLESGHTPSRRNPEYWNGDIPWVGIPDAAANHGRTLMDTLSHITQDGLENSSTRLLPANTVCLSRTASIGYVVIMGVPMCTSQDFLNWVCGPDLDHRYLSYILRLEASNIRERFAFGSTHKTLYYPDAKALHVAVPSLGEQRAIAGVLGALDDKIAANARLLGTIHQLGLTHFTRHATGTARLTDLARFVNGRNFTKGASGTGRVVIRIAELNSGLGGSTVYSGVESPADHVANPGDILFAWSGSLTLKRWMLPTGMVNQHIFKVIPRESTPAWLAFHALRTQMPTFKAIAADKATTMGHIQRRHLEVDVPIPNPEAQRKIQPLMQSLWDLELATEQESQKLAQLRDTLLPALMDGRLRIRDAIEQVEGVL